jgi:hypothetical protein
VIANDVMGTISTINGKVLNTPKVDAKTRMWLNTRLIRNISCGHLARTISSGVAVYFSLMGCLWI